MEVPQVKKKIMTWLKVYISLEKEIFPEAAYNLCVYESNICSNKHYLCNKAWNKIQACTRFEPMMSVIPVQCSTNWANKVIGFKSSTT